MPTHVHSVPTPKSMFASIWKLKLLNHISTIYDSRTNYLAIENFQIILYGESYTYRKFKIHQQRWTCLGPSGDSAQNHIISIYCHSSQGTKASWTYWNTLAYFAKWSYLLCFKSVTHMAPSYTSKKLFFLIGLCETSPCILAWQTSLM